MSYEDLAGDTAEHIINGGEIFASPAWVYHKYEILEECVFLEPRKVSFKEKPDTFDRKEFDRIQKKFQTSKSLKSTK